MVIGVLENFLIVIVGPHRAIGGSTTFTLEPSGSLVSHIGFAWFTSLPASPTIRCIISSSFSVLSNLLLSFVSLPFCSIKILSGPFIITSVMLSSEIIVSSKPKPLIELYTCSTIDAL